MSVCFKHCRWCAVEDCALRITDEVVCDHYEQRQQTNADRIRAMSDEELAEFISGKARTFGEEYEGYMSALEWLKQEAQCTSG